MELQFMNVTFRCFIINRGSLSIWAAAPTELLRKIKAITVELGYNVIKGAE
jgi:hypothetical protein